MKKKLLIAMAALLVLGGGVGGAVFTGVLPIDELLATDASEADAEEAAAEGDEPTKKGVDITVVAEPAPVPEFIEGPEVTWRLSYWGDARVESTGIEFVSDYVAQRTEGRFNIEIGWNGELSRPKDNLAGLQAGKFEAAVVCSHFHIEELPTLTVVTLPFLPLDDIDVFEYVIEKVYALPSLRKEMKSWNALPYLSSLYPQHQVIGTGRPPSTLDDWRGRAVAAPAELGEAMRTIGAIATGPGGDDELALLTSAKVGAVLTPFSPGPLRDELARSAKWYTTNLDFGTSDCPLSFNAKAYKALPLPYKLLLKEAKPLAYAALKEAYREDGNSNWEEASDRLHAITYSGDDIYSFKAFASAPVWTRWISRWKDVFPARESLDFVLERAKKGEALKGDGKLG